MRSIKTLLLFVVGLTALASLGSDSSSCTPNFPFKQGWLGADDAYSIPFPDGRVVWIFGDTLIGKKRVVIGNEPKMVRNSIGVSTCNNGKWDVDYVIRKSGTGKPLDFFQARNSSYWYWPMDGFYHDKNLYVTLLCMRNKPVTKEDPLGFETCGSDVVRIGGLDANPQDWTMEYFELVPDGVKAYPSSTTFIEGEYAYIYTLYEAGKRPMVLTRIPLHGLGDPRKNLEYLAQDGNWKSGLDPADAKPVMDNGVSEMSVRYHPEMKKWVAVMIDPHLTGTILFRTAMDMTGPWSKAETIYTIPEMQKHKPGYDVDTVCYAGKEHPEFEKAGDLLFTYACNTMKVPKLAERPDIYFPKVIRMPMPN
ncbi:MAG TPA: DUF4185 domain-containing protein [Terriglobales bacterium]